MLLDLATVSCHLHGVSVFRDVWSLLTSTFPRVLRVVFLLLGDFPTSEFYMLTFRNTLFHLHRRCIYTACEDGRDSVPKRRNIKFRRGGITKM